MRKFIVGSLLASAIGGGSLAAVAAATAGSAGASPTCYSGGQALPAAGPLGTITVNPGSGGTAGAIQVCSEGSSVVNGTVTASGSATTASGYAVANGDATQNPNGPTGYIGVEGGPSGVAVVGCSKGDYNNGTDSNNDGTSGASAAGPNDGVTDSNGNNVILNSSGQGSATNPAVVATGGNCSLGNEPTP